MNIEDFYFMSSIKHTYSGLLRLTRRSSRRRNARLSLSVHATASRERAPRVTRQSCDLRMNTRVGNKWGQDCNVANYERFSQLYKFAILTRKCTLIRSQIVYSRFHPRIARFQIVNKPIHCNQSYMLYGTISFCCCPCLQFLP
jgi:hypothetical protein